MASNPFDQFDAPAAAGASGNPFDQFDAPAAAPPAATGLNVQEDTGVTLGDYGRAVMAGGGQLVGGAGWLAEKLGAETVGKSMQKLGDQASDYWLGGMSAGAKAEMAKDFIEKSDDGLLGYQWGDAGLNTVGLHAAQSLLGTAGGMGAGGLIAKGLQVARVPAVASGIIGYGAGEAGVAAGSAGKQTRDHILAMPIDQVMEHPEFKSLAQMMPGDNTPEKMEAVRERIANLAANQAAAVTAGTTFVLSAPMGALIGKLTAGLPIATTKPRAMAAATLGEAGQEFFQSGAEAMAQNAAIQGYADENQALMDDVLNQAVGGAAAGGVMGLALSPAAKAAPHPADTAPPPVDAGVVLGDVEPTPAAPPEAAQPAAWPNADLPAAPGGTEINGEFVPAGTNPFDVFDAAVPMPTTGLDVAGPAPAVDLPEVSREALDTPAFTEAGDSTSRLEGLVAEIRAQYPNMTPEEQAKADGLLEQYAGLVPQGTEDKAPEVSPELAAAAEKAKARAEKRRQDMQPNLEKDSLLTVIAKLGGINTENARNYGGFDPADMRSAKGYKIYRPFNKNGLDLDYMAERLRELGYSYQTPRELSEAIGAEMRGAPQFIVGSEEAAIQQMGDRYGEQDDSGVAQDVTAEEFASLGGPAYYPEEDFTPAYDAEAYNPDWDGQASELADLIRDAQEIDEGATESILSKPDLSDGDIAAELWAVIQKGPANERPEEDAAAAEAAAAAGEPGQAPDQPGLAADTRGQGTGLQAEAPGRVERDLEAMLKGQEARRAAFDDDIRQTLDKDGFALYKQDNGLVVTIGQSAKQPGKYQATFYNDSGALSDTTYDSPEQLFNDLSGTAKRYPADQIDEIMGPIVTAENDFQLKQQTPADLEAMKAADKAREDAEKAAEQKAKADAQIGGFALTGSDREADTAAAAGQTGLFDQPAASQGDMLKDGKPEIQVRPLPFASGMGRAADFDAAIQSDAGVGVDATDLSANMIEKIGQASTKGKEIFVDSGAFRAFKSAVKNKKDPEPVDFGKVFDRYRKISDSVKAAGGSPDAVMMVMPDVIGDQAGTTALLTEHADEIRKLYDANHEIVIPFQRGDKPLADVYEEISAMLGHGDFVVGIPSNAEALSDKEILDFLKAKQPERVHILGAVQNNRFKRRLEVIREAYSDINPGVTADANVLRSKINEVAGLGRAARDKAIREILNGVVPDGIDELTPVKVEKPQEQATDEEAQIDADLARAQNGYDTIDALKAAGFKANLSKTSMPKIGSMFIDVTLPESGGKYSLNNGGRQDDKWTVVGNYGNGPKADNLRKAVEQTEEFARFLEMVTGKKMAAPKQAGLDLEKTSGKSKTIAEFRNKLEQMPAATLKDIAKKSSVPVRAGQKTDLIDRMALAREAADTLGKYEDQQAVKAAIDAGEITGKQLAEWAGALYPARQVAADISTSLNLSLLVQWGAKSRAFSLPVGELPEPAQVEKAPRRKFTLDGIREEYPEMDEAPDSFINEGLKRYEKEEDFAPGYLTGTIERVATDIRRGKTDAKTVSLNAKKIWGMMQDDHMRSGDVWKALAKPEDGDTIAAELLDDPTTPADLRRVAEAYVRLQSRGPITVDTAKALRSEVTPQLLERVAAKNKGASIGDMMDAIMAEWRPAKKAAPAAASDIASMSEDDFDALLEDAAPAPEKAEPKKETRIPLLEGDRFKTVSGRITAPFPKTNYKRAEFGEQKLRAWLKNEYIEEARSRGDRYNETLANALDVKNWSQADGDGVNLYLFDRPEGDIGDLKVEAAVIKAAAVKKKTGAKRPAQKSESAGEALKKAAKAGVKGADEALTGLAELFGGKKLSSGFTFDEDTYAKAKPHFKAALESFVEAGKSLADFIRFIVDNFGAGIKPYLKQFHRDVSAGKIEIKGISPQPATMGAEAEEKQNVPDTGTDTAGRGAAGKEPENAGAPGAADRPADRGAGLPVEEAGAGWTAEQGDTGLPGTSPAAAGEAGIPDLFEPGERPRFDGSDTGDQLDNGIAEPGDEGVESESEGDSEPERIAQSLQEQLAEKRKLQDKANGLPVELADPANVEKTVPYLLKEQHGDVVLAERRFKASKLPGILFTNGTGTGKTYTGLGILARHIRATGNNDVLILAPTDPKVKDWIVDAENLGIEARQLKDKKDPGKGVVVTTYANFRDNWEIQARDLSLVLVDESHYLKESAKSDNLSMHAFRAIANHPDGVYYKAMFRHPEAKRLEYGRRDNERAFIKKKTEELRTRYKNGPEWKPTPKQIDTWRNEANAEWKTKHKEDYTRVEREIQAQKETIAEQHPLGSTKAVFLSASPFAYHFALDYAEGYLFEYGDRSKESREFRGYNSGSDRERFFMRHFGYRMKYNRLTQPDREVDINIMERQFHETLKQQGAISGRQLEVDYDYSREFVLFDTELGHKVDEGINILRGYSPEGELLNADEKIARGIPRFEILPQIIHRKFNYIYMRQLMEAIKAGQLVERVQKHLDMGRKVVLFHDFQEFNGRHPFDLGDLAPPKGYNDADDIRMGEMLRFEIQDFHEYRPDLKALPLSGLKSVVRTMQDAFGDRARFISGKVSKTDKMEAKRLFNEDDSGVDIIVVQRKSGREGISLHDTTKKHQRVLMDVGLPVAPVDALQTEGRVYRWGVASDAVIEYPVLGTQFERIMYANKVAERARTVENLAMGNRARNLESAFKDGYLGASEFDPSTDQGKGGKDRDRAYNELSPFEVAKTLYFGRAKNTKSRGNREGFDYFATPEPVGFKMVEWANIQAGDRALEPSAGHGAIARWFPENSKNVFVEPSNKLISEIGLLANGEGKAIAFEDLPDGSKFDAIVMNPPWGVGGADAVPHLERAMRHLKNGGRIVAFMPQGPAADKRLDALLYGKDGEAEELKKKHKAGLISGAEFEQRKRQLDNFFKIADISMPAVTFERAGTTARGRILVLDRYDNAEDAPYQMGQMQINAEKIGDLFDQIELIELPGRAPVTLTPREAMDKIGLSLEAGDGGYIVSGKGTFEHRHALHALGGVWDGEAKAWKFEKDPGKAFMAYLENPDSLPAAPPVEGAAAATPDGDVEAVLAARGVHIRKTETRNGTPVWELYGDTMDIKDTLKRLGARWYGPKKVWSFYNDPTQKLLGAFSDTALSAGPVVSMGKPVEGAPPLAEDAKEAVAKRIALKLGIPNRLAVVATEADLPAEVQKEIEAQNAKGQVRGVFHNEKVFVVSSNVATEQDIAEALLHEGAGHLGLRELFGKETQRQAAALFLKLGGVSGLRQIAKDAGLEDAMRPYFQNAGKMSKERREFYLVDETLAHLQGSKAYESLPEKVKRAVKEWLGAVRNWLRRKGLAILAQYSDADLAYLLRRMERAAAGERGDPRGTMLMVAWHGTPHQFDKFTTEKIGTGEGAQAYGWGLYFAGKREVAEWYRKNLAGQMTVLHWKGIPLDKWASQGANPEELTKEYGPVAVAQAVAAMQNYGGDFNLAIGSLKGWASNMDSDIYSEAARFLEEQKDNLNFPVKGALYQVELAPEEDEYLLWDESFHKQSDKVKEALGSIEPFKDLMERRREFIAKVEKVNPEAAKLADSMIMGGYDQRRNSINWDTLDRLISWQTQADKGLEFNDIHDIGDELDSVGYSGGEIYYAVMNETGANSWVDQQRPASEMLHQAGIRGVKYLDGSSRRKGDGHHNYVIFHEDDVTITAALSRGGRPNTVESRLMASLRKGQPIDRAFRAAFNVVGSVDDHGVWHPPAGVKNAGQKVGRALGAAGNKAVERMPWAGQLIETARAGLIDRYKVPQDFIDREYKAEAEERQLAHEAIDFIKQIQEKITGPEDSRVLHDILTGEQISTEQWNGLAQEIRDAIDAMGQRALELNLITPEQHKRHKGTYLHRVYLKHEAPDEGTLAGWVGARIAGRRRKIIGDTLKGRGMSFKVTQDRLQKDVPPEWWPTTMKKGEADKTLKGRKFIVLDKLAPAGAGTETAPGIEAGGRRPRVLQRVYWPADMDLPAKYRPGPDGRSAWENRGVWEVTGTEGGRVILWRDFTKAERDSMGEILDARYTIARTYSKLARDLSTASFFKDIAENEAWTWNGEGEPPNSADAKQGTYASFGSYDWVKVPVTDIPKTGGKKRWGALAGKYVRAEIWRDINELDRMQNPGTWRKVLTQWKLNKTARSPVVHMNNVMSNFLFADLADVRMRDLVRALDAMRNGESDPDYRDAQIHGAFGSSFIQHEIKREILDPILKDLTKQNLGNRGWLESHLPERLALLSRIMDKMVRGIGNLDEKMINLYQLEDEWFRMATYLRQRELGMPADQAARIARDQFLNYDIRAPWINAARNTVMPFISYTYRAVPVIARSVAARPWKIAKYVTIAYLAEALAYALAGGDEDEERRSMRDEVQGRTWLGFHRMLRLPANDEYGNPYFIDIRRWIPAGDVFDTGQNPLGIPAPLQLSGPLMLGMELFLNKSAFTQKEIWDTDADTAGEQIGKGMDHLWKSWMPSAAWIPNSWYWEKVIRAAGGEARDRLGRPYNLGSAVASSFGIKVQPHDVELGFRDHAWRINTKKLALQAKLKQAGRDASRGMISDDKYQEQIDRIMGQIETLQESADQIFSPAD